MSLEPDKKELVWLPKSIVTQINEVTEDAQREAIILAYIKSTREDIENYINLLDEDVVRFKGLLITAKREFEKYKTEELGKTYEIWEHFEKDLPNVKSKIETLKSEIQPIKNEISSLNESLHKISTWEIKELLDIIQKIAMYLDNEKIQKVIEFVITQYPKK